MPKSAASITDNGSAAYPVMLMKEGPGTLILSGSNTYTGGTFVDGRVLGSRRRRCHSSGHESYRWQRRRFIFDPGVSGGNLQSRLQRPSGIRKQGRSQIPATITEFHSGGPRARRLRALGGGVRRSSGHGNPAALCEAPPRRLRSWHDGLLGSGGKEQTPVRVRPRALRIESLEQRTLLNAGGERRTPGPAARRPWSRLGSSG